MHHLPTTLATKAQALVRYADCVGADLDRLLASVSLGRSSLQGTGARVPSRAIVGLWSHLGRETGDADLGLSLAESEDGATGAFGLVGFRAMMCKTAGEALTSFGRHIRLLSEDTDARSAGDGVFEVSFGAADPWTSRWMAERAIASCVLLSRRWTGERIVPKRIRFRHARPARISTHERLFDCAIDFEQDTNAVEFDEDTCRLALRPAPGEIGEYLESLARAASQDLPRDDAAHSVTLVLREELHRGDPGLAAVARRLGVSARTLQRRLLEQRVGYHALVDRVRREIAVPLVTSSSLPMAIVRERVGYSEDKAFRRAFRRWTGSSPAELRRAR
jgi:AraC-like DNA-binding protein